MTDENISDVTIKKLPQERIVQLTKGHVVSDVFSVAKELFENALDSNATCIGIYTHDRSITIEDNGCGISKEDMEMLCQRYCTSKYDNETNFSNDFYSNFCNDFSNNFYYGYRGEALHAISQYASLTIFSKHKGIEYCFDSVTKNIFKINTIKKSGTRVIVGNFRAGNYVKRSFYGANGNIAIHTIGRISTMVQRYAAYYAGKINVWTQNILYSNFYKKYDVDEDMYVFYSVNNENTKVGLIVNGRLVEDREIKNAVTNASNHRGDVVLVLENIKASFEHNAQKRYAEIEDQDKESIITKINENLQGFKNGTITKSISLELVKYRNKNFVEFESMAGSETKIEIENGQTIKKDKNTKNNVNTNVREEYYIDELYENNKNSIEKRKEICFKKSKSEGNKIQHILNLENASYIGTCKSRFTYAIIESSLYILKDVWVKSVEEFENRKKSLMS